MMKFKTLLFNTFSLSLYGMIAGFFPPIILAIMLNSTPFAKFKKSSKR